MRRFVVISIITFVVSSLAFGKTITTGKGFGFKDYVVVDVTRDGDKIEDIEVIEHKDTEKYATPAFELLIEDIIEKQSVDVDSFAGATGSSLGLKLAVEDALSK